MNLVINKKGDSFMAAFNDFESSELFIIVVNSNNDSIIFFSVSLVIDVALLYVISWALLNNDFILIVEYSKYEPVFPSRSANFSSSNT